MQGRNFKPEKPWLLAFAVMGLLSCAFLVASLTRDSKTAGIFCKASSAMRLFGSSPADDDIQLVAIRHYATSTIVPQQSFEEITITYDVLRSLGRPAKFLVFGLGHDSVMWASLNPHGTTLFLEESPGWVKTVLKDAPFLRAHIVNYRTHLSEADELTVVLKTEPSCFPNSTLRGNKKCKLALDMLPDEVYDTEWDLIMIDAPRGYAPELPGRMSAIFSAAVMARNRKGSGVTHVFLHDVDRVVEKSYGKMILCEKNLVKGVGRLWHFEIPPSTKPTIGFC